jgi:hypothetical protein
MMTRNKTLVGVTIATALCAATLGAYIAYADLSFATPPPMRLPYHGYLEQGGVPVNGPQDMEFVLTWGADDPVGFWSEEHLGVQMNAGEFSVVLGESGTLAPEYFDPSTIYVRVCIPNCAEGVMLSGAQQLLSAPFAIKADRGADFEVKSLHVEEGLPIAITVADEPLGCGGGTANTLELSTVNPDRAMCFLTGTQWARTAGTMTSAHCRVRRVSGVWRLEANCNGTDGHLGVCRASCIEW